MKRGISEISENFKEVPVGWVHSSMIARQIADNWGKFSLQEGLSIARCTNGKLLRVEYAYNPVHAVSIGAHDNIARRHFVVNDIPDFVSTAGVYNDVSVSIHEIIPSDTPVKLWFDLDGFDLDIDYLIMINYFNANFMHFMSSVLGVSLKFSDFQWLESCSSTKNSLHLTISNHHAADNHVHMKNIAESFIKYLRDTKAHEKLAIALLKPGVIDTAVYRKNSSIRVCNSIKLKDPDRRLNMVPKHHCGDASKSYVTCIDQDSKVILQLTTIQDREGGSVVDCEVQVVDILRSALRKSVISIKSMRRVGDTFSCVVRNHRRCGIAKVRHSHDTDVYFLVDPFKPYVTQKCFSLNCKGDEKRYMHRSGIFGPMQRSEDLKEDLVFDYMNKVKELIDREDDEKEKPSKEDIKRKESRLQSYTNLVFEFYYNRFFCTITDEREFLIGVTFREDGTGRIIKRTTKPREFLQQRCTVPFIKDWVESKYRKACQFIGFFPWDKSMLAVRHGIGICHVNSPTEIVHSPVFDKPFFNEFCGLAINHRDAWAYEYTKEEVAPFVMHIINVWAGGDQEIAEWILQWLASAYQRPWERLDTALILQGEKGCGKGIIVEHMGRLIGSRHYWQIGNLNNLTGTYTHPKFQKACIGFIDEAYWGGDPKSATALKGIITEQKQDSNVKYQPQKSFDSYMNIIIASNNDRIVEYTSDNRRYQFLQMKPVPFADDEEKQSYFDRLRSVPALAIASFLLRRVCTCSFDKKKIFKTIASTDQLIESFKPMETWWFNELCSSTDDDDDEGIFSKKSPIKLLRDLMIQHTKDNGQRYSNVGTGRAFTTQLAKMCPSIGKSGRMYIGPGTQVRCLTIPSNEICRRDFNAYTKHTIDYSM